MKHVVAPEGDVAHGAAEAARVIDVGQRPTHQVHRPEITTTSRALCRYFSKNTHKTLLLKHILIQTTSSEKASLNHYLFIKHLAIKFVFRYWSMWQIHESQIKFNQNSLECFWRKRSCWCSHKDTLKSNRKTGVNVGLPNFCYLVSEGPDIIMHQLKSIRNSPFKDSHSHPIHACFPMNASTL